MTWPIQATFALIFSAMREIKPEVNQDLVDQLKQMLEEAEQGHIQSFAAAMVRPNATTSLIWVGGYYPIHLVGELRILECEIIDAHVDITRKPAMEFCE